MPPTTQFMFENSSHIHYKVFLIYTAAKTMVQQKICQDCNERQTCQEVYQQMGEAKGPSVVSRVVIAFLLPLTFFIASLAAFETILAKAIDSQGLKTALSSLLALSITFVLILIIKAINRGFKKDKQHQVT
jgi:hypothetical protein